MKPRLLSTRREQTGRPERRRSERRARLRRAERQQRAADARHTETHTPERRPALEIPAKLEIPAEPVVPHSGCDPDVEKVRRAGGPEDEAVYSCACGYLFSAAVSTTVSCPHCGTGQAW